jgi:hypothetical protein
MSNIMELLRMPVLGVVAGIIFLAGTILIGAFLALVGQVGLLLRLKPWNRTNNPAGQTDPAAEAIFSKPPFDPTDVIEGVWQEMN